MKQLEFREALTKAETLARAHGFGLAPTGRHPMMCATFREQGSDCGHSFIGDPWDCVAFIEGWASARARFEPKPSLAMKSDPRDEEGRKRAATALGELARAIIDDRAVYEITCEPDADYELVQSWHTLDKPPTPILRTFGRIWRVKAHERR